MRHSSYLVPMPAEMTAEMVALPAQALHQPQRTHEQNCDKGQLHERGSEQQAPQQVLTLHPPVQADLTEEKVRTWRHYQS